MLQSAVAESDKLDVLVKHNAVHMQKLEEWQKAIKEGEVTMQGQITSISGSTQTIRTALGSHEGAINNTLAQVEEFRKKVGAISKAGPSTQPGAYQAKGIMDYKAISDLRSLKKGRVPPVERKTN